MGAILALALHRGGEAVRAVEGSCGKGTRATSYSMAVWVASMRLVDTMVTVLKREALVGRLSPGGHSCSEFRRKNLVVPTRSSPAALRPH